MSENTWAVFSIGMISTNKVCPAANDVTAMQIQSCDTIQIRPGCYVRTMDHVISADESETIEIAIKTMDWAGKITDLFHKLCRASATNTMGNSTPRSFWTNWINLISEAKLRLQTLIGLSRLRRP